MTSDAVFALVFALMGLLVVPIYVLWLSDDHSPSPDLRSGDDKGGVNETGTTPRAVWKPVGPGPFGDENMSIVRKYDLGTGKHTESKIQFRDGGHVVNLHVARVGPPPLVGRIICDYCPDASLRGMALANKAALAELRLIEEANRGD